MDSDKKVLDYIRDTAEYVKTDDGLVSASQMLEKFLFPPYLQHTPIGRLSGGEKRRLNLLRVLMEAPNVLILDEPTNDLDIATMTIFEQFLDTFDGIVITVSHDRYFLDRTVNRIFAFEGTNIKQYEGGYTDYKNKCTYEEETEKPAAEKKTYTNTHEKKLKFTYKEQKEFETIESDISSLETKIADLEEAMAKSATDFVKLSELTEEKKKLEKELEYKMERWEYLEELNEKIKEQEQ
jgi:ATP-binding cassette subfamily F protein uup